MKLADSNVWLALTVSTHQFHETAVAWMENESSTDTVAFCRATQLSFLRLLTTAHVLRLYGSTPLTNQEAWLVCERYLADKRITYLEEPPELEKQWNRLAVCAVPSPKLWMDAYLAAFAISSGCRLVTADKAFRQFKGLDLTVLKPSNSSTI